MALQVILMSLVGSAMGDRMRMKMDFDWLFHLGQQGLYPNCSDSDFPINMMGVQCQGLSQAPAANISECREQCCGDVNCGTYVKSTCFVLIYGVNRIRPTTINN